MPTSRKKRVNGKVVYIKKSESGEAKASGKAGRGASDRQIKNYGGFEYSTNGQTIRVLYKDGKIYNISQLQPPKEIKTTSSIYEMIEKAKKSGKEVKILSPEQMEEVWNKRRKDREATSKVDYETGQGVPWGNKNNRQAARRSRLASRRRK